MKESEKNDNLKILLSEINLILDRQHSDFDLVYNKLNWIVVSDFVFLVGVMGLSCINPLVAFSVCVSIFVAFLGYTPEKFKHTQKISDQQNNVFEENYIKNLIEQKKQAFTSNQKRYDSINLYLEFSKWILISSLVFHFFFIWLVGY